MKTRQELQVMRMGILMTENESNTLKTLEPEVAAVDNKITGHSHFQSGAEISRLRHHEELLQARLMGVHLADGIDPDEHVRQLRDGWEERDLSLGLAPSEIPEEATE